MAYYIRKIDKSLGKFEIRIPKKLIREKGWENALYVRIEDQWGDRIMITRVSDEEELEKDNKGATPGRD